MKKSWKKGIATAMSVLLAAGIAGCGQANTANSTAAAGDAATTEQTVTTQSSTEDGDLTVVKNSGTKLYLYWSQWKNGHLKRTGRQEGKSKTLG